jgi:hypothetical protein
LAIKLRIDRPIEFPHAPLAELAGGPVRVYMAHLLKICEMCFSGMVMASRKAWGLPTPSQSPDGGLLCEVILQPSEMRGSTGQRRPNASWLRECWQHRPPGGNVVNCGDYVFLPTARQADPCCYGLTARL